MDIEYQVIEDNDGGLTLVVFQGTIYRHLVAYLRSGWEANIGQLSGALQKLQDNPECFMDWGDCVANPQDAYEDLAIYPLGIHGWSIVVEMFKGTLTYHYGDMGKSASLEFK